MRRIVADPVVLVLLLLLGGLGLTLLRRRLGRTLLISGVAALYLLATPFFSTLLLRLAETPLDVSPVARAPQAIVILSAGAYLRAPEYEGDTVDALTLERIRYGARLQRRTGLPILVTGGRPRDSAQSIAESMRRALVEDFGVPVRWVEGRARTTYENAEQSAALLRAEGIDTIYLVTHAVHMRRAQEVLERSRLTVIPAATGFTSTDPDVSLRELVPRATTLVRSSYALHELIGRLWYRLAYANSGAPIPAYALPLSGLAHEADRYKWWVPYPSIPPDRTPERAFVFSSRCRNSRTTETARWERVQRNIVPPLSSWLQCTRHPSAGTPPAIAVRG
jgi:uncharacterized SAM-binding protein YcdF (DUF218 family)